MYLEPQFEMVLRLQVKINYKLTHCHIVEAV